MRRQAAAKDANNQLFWMAPKAIVTIPANTAIDSTYLAIKPETDVNIYFDDETANTFGVLAGDVLSLPQNRVLKLDTDTKCLVY